MITYRSLLQKNYTKINTSFLQISQSGEEISMYGLLLVIIHGGYKGSLLLVFGGYCNLMIALKSIKEAHPWMSKCGIQKLINFWHQKLVFGVGSI